MQPTEEPRGTSPSGGVPPPPASQPSAPHPPAAPPDTQSAAPSAQPAAPQRIKRTAVSSLWIGLIIGAILLVLLIVFIAENSRTVTINLIFGDTRTSLALGLLLSAVIGALLVAVPGTMRILQLRKEVKRRMR